MESDRRELDVQIQTMKQKGGAINLEIQNVQRDIQSFDTQQGQQLSFMKRHFPEIAAGWEWIEQNQGQFEKEVFGPPMISCSIKDERYSDQIQSLFQQDDFACFTAQTKNDYKKLTNQLYRVMSLSVVVKTCSNPLDMFKRPVSPEEATHMGLDGFALDYLEGPAPVLAMLCSERRLHQSGVSLKEHGDAEYERLVNSGKVSQWAAGRQSYLVRRRKEYGPQAMTTVTKSINPGRFWTSQPVDSQEKTELTRKLEELNNEKQEMKMEFRSLQARKTEVETKMGRIEEAIVSHYYAGHSWWVLFLICY
jgi:structural maintenance of chromosomes protein 5